MKIYTAILLLILVLALPACSAREPQQSIVVTPPAMSVTITRTDCPSMVVQVGMQVVWTNGDIVPLALKLEELDENDTVAGTGQAEIGPGNSFSTQFSEAGTYRFYCSDNTDVYATITVE